VARNLQTFDVGNRVGEKLTPETHALFCNTLRATGRLSISAARCCIAMSTARHWLQRGAREETGPYREFLDDVEKARADFLLLASRRLSQLAVGGVVQLPAYDKKTGAPLRDHRKDCPAIPGANCGCELIVTERVLLPNANALMFQLDRSDPTPNLETPGPELPERPVLTAEERQRAAFEDYRLVREALEILETCGQPLGVSLGGDFVETTARVADVLPELPPATATVDVTPADEPAAPTDPSDKPPEAF
jgi:hypothetical protein